MAVRLHLTLLGEPQVTEHNIPITGFISAKAEALLYYLVVTGETHSRDVLASLLWGEMAQTTARKNLTKALSNLRKLVGAYLTVDHHTASFNQDSPHWLDVRVFEEALETQELETLQKAVDLYRGDFLESFYVKDAPAFDDWLRSEQERWRELMLQTLETLANQLIARGDYASAIEFVRQLLDLDSYREPAHRQMMILLARTGRRSAALAQYKTCRRILAEELGVEPAAETQVLYKRIEAGSVSTPHNLPHLTTTFVGREVELSKIIVLLNDPACRLLTIAGPGGIGKTRLALQAATHYAQQTVAFDLEGGFPDGIYLVRLAPLDSIEAVVSTLAEALGYSFHTEGEPQQQVLNYLHQKELLLVLDNFEHLLTSPRSVSKEGGKGGTSSQGKTEGVLLITTILESAPSVKILTTSRARLNLQGEHIYYLAGMPFPDWKSSPATGVLPTDSPRLHRNADLAKTVVDYAAVQLFINQACQVKPDFELTEDNVIDVVQICRLVQGMPLGLLLAAAWVEILTPTEIAVEIARSLDFLETDMRDVPQRQRSIRAAFDHSWNLLTDRERDIFQRLSIFRGHFSRQAAQTVTGASLRELMTLVNKSLLRHTATGWYVVHELLRQYAAEKLDQLPDTRQAARNQHGAYYAAILQECEVELKGPRQQTTLAEIEVEGENIRVAWDWAIIQQQVEWLSQAMDGLGHFYVRRGRYREGETAFRRAAESLVKHTAVEGLCGRAKLLAWQAVFSHQVGQIGLANQLLQKSLTLLDGRALVNHDVRREKAFILLHLGEIKREVDREQARGLYEESLALYRALDDQWGTANTLASLGWLIQHFGAYDEARHLYTESLTLRQLLEDRWGIANSLISLGSVALYQGHPKEAERLVRQSISIRQETGDRVGIARSLSKLGETLTRLGKFAEAQTPLAESKSIYDDLGLQDAAAFTVAMLGDAMIHLGEYQQALHKAQVALTRFQELGSSRGVGYSLLVMGWAQLGVGQAAEAQQLLQDSLTIYQEIGQRDELTQTLVLLGYATFQLDNAAQAQQHLFEGLHTATQIRAFMPMMLALPAITLLLMHQKRFEEAIELYALASHYPFVAHSRWFEDLAGRRVAAIDLPPEIAAMAQERGKAKLLEATVMEILGSNYLQESDQRGHLERNRPTA